MTTFNEAFWRWFGESKIVDANGQPLLVSHGTKSKFKAFDLSFFQKGVGDGGWYGKGFYFTPHLGLATRYAYEATGKGKPIVLDCYLSIQNPFYVEDSGGAGQNIGVEMEYQFGKEELTRLTGESKGFRPYNVARVNAMEILTGKGYDGIVVRDTNKRVIEIIAYKPQQVKSAKNDGTWDVDDAKIASNPPRSKRRNIGLKEGQFVNVQFDNGLWLGVDGGMTDVPQEADFWEATEEANRWAALCASRNKKRTKKRVLWRLFGWNSKDLSKPIFQTPFVTLEEAVLWNELQMDIHPELYGFPKAPIERGGRR